MRITTPPSTSADVLAQIAAVDGAGSGLDSDLLDGLSSASFARSGANTDITSLAGTATNDSASAGKVGEVISSTIAFASPVALTTATPADVTSVSLTAGDWDIGGMVYLVTNGATTMTGMTAWINTTSATQPAAFTFPYASINTAITTGTDPALALNTCRLSLSATTTVYLGVQAGFAINTAAAAGHIIARRAR